MRTQNLLTYPGTQGLDLDDPGTTVLRKEILQKKLFLRKIYIDWYFFIQKNLPDISGKVLELGSGAGFLKEYVPDLISSDIFFLNFVDVILDGCYLPFRSGSLKAIVMINVLHHIPNVSNFFSEASRCVRKDGAILLIEPWNTRWSKFVYTHFHHEPFLPDAQNWMLDKSGPLSGANDALPWILFHRDQAQFTQKFPEWEIETVTPGYPFRYLFSGGMSKRCMTPNWSYPFWKQLEFCMRPFIGNWGMFAEIILRKI